MHGKMVGYGRGYILAMKNDVRLYNTRHKLVFIESGFSMYI